LLSMPAATCDRGQIGRIECRDNISDAEVHGLQSPIKWHRNLATVFTEVAALLRKNVYGERHINPSVG
jgi:hypothetical protein